MRIPVLLAPFATPDGLSHAEHRCLFDALGKLSWKPDAPDNLVWVNGRQLCVVRQRDTSLRFSIDVAYEVTRSPRNGLALADGRLYDGDVDELVVHYVRVQRRQGRP